MGVGMSAELLIIQDANSQLETHGLPGAAFSSGQKSPSTRFVVSSSRLSLMSISSPLRPRSGQPFRMPGPNPRPFRRTRPAGNNQQPDRRRFAPLRPPGKETPAAPLRIESRRLVSSGVLLNQNINVKLSHGADVEGIVALEIFRHVDHIHRLELLVRKVGFGFYDFARRLPRGS